MVDFSLQSQRYIRTVPMIQVQELLHGFLSVYRFPLETLLGFHKLFCRGEAIEFNPNDEA